MAQPFVRNLEVQSLWCSPAVRPTVTLAADSLTGRLGGCQAQPHRSMRRHRTPSPEDLGYWGALRLFPQSPPPFTTSTVQRHHLATATNTFAALLHCLAHKRAQGTYRDHSVSLLCSPESIPSILHSVGPVMVHRWPVLKTRSFACCAAWAPPAGFRYGGIFGRGSTSVITAVLHLARHGGLLRGDNRWAPKNPQDAHGLVTDPMSRLAEAANFPFFFFTCPHELYLNAV